MNASRIDNIIEVLFQGGPGGEDAPEPLNKRFNWKPQGGQPPAPKPAQPTSIPVGTGADINPGDMDGDVPIRDMTDRTPRHPMNQMIPPNELATIDDLMDRYLQMQKMRGPEAAKAWFDMYRTAEFESLTRRMVESMLDESFEDALFKVPEKDLPFVQSLADERGIPIEQAVADYLEMYGNEPATSKPIRMKGRRFNVRGPGSLEVPPYLSRSTS